ncbi:Asp-tRNA(Asn)/Glu-tRNA(Gln) amidotransferase subunit GatC [Acuticoccus mangrovi]|uniref:Aspartyl/glutamyl-tRNA(Asn/Gln) amidotransferase subunit C n=1 Tax=Acuticoccus mangrovi TaxID=2796142 RepID=A0A934ILV9_9HYPH|nr:Asp-tRNA(Asn)/Glu-tRNA(Gln) amidotransferase subunit GatC [Acuticoccus mangrovi]MBJ3774743.1 Asp-tRNA(Asn)/Glu-tRNA(Gln) amidotransferase subunit GatC [Acuticoccus mangrovi]
MSVDLETVRRVAHLARIKVGDDEAVRLQDELNAILGFVEQLNEVDVDGVAPMTAAVDASLRRRVDEVTDGGNPERVLANAPAADDGFFVVPKVVE